MTPRTVAQQAPLSMAFSREEYWSGAPCPSPGDLSDQVSNPRTLGLLHCRWVLYWLSHQQSQYIAMNIYFVFLVAIQYYVIYFANQIIPALFSFLFKIFTLGNYSEMYPLIKSKIGFAPHNSILHQSTCHQSHRDKPQASTIKVQHQRGNEPQSLLTSFHVLCGAKLFQPDCKRVV